MTSAARRGAERPVPRRAVVAGALGAALSACTASRPRPVPPTSSGPGPTADQDAALVAAALSGVLRLVAAYRGAAGPDLHAFAAEHGAHAAALRAWLLRGTRSTVPSGPATPAHAAGPQPAALAVLESGEAGRRTAQALRASGELARLLASIAAAEAAHAALLRRRA